MASFYSVKIRSSGSTCTKIKSSNGKFTLEDYNKFEDTDSLKKFISGKKNINYLLYENRFLKSNISINRNITDRSAINSMIFTKLQKEHSEIDAIRFKSSISEDNHKKETIRYSINGLYQNSKSYNTFNELKTFENCNLISLENYALYSFAKTFLPNQVFISVWVDEKSLTVVAGTKNELLYSRNEAIENLDIDISQEISKNIMFVKQKVRDVKFDTLTLNGSIFEDQAIFNSVYNQAKLPLSSFYPIKGTFNKFSPKNFNNCLIDLGSLYIDYTLDFTSSSVKSSVQYNKLLKLYIPVLLVLFTYFGIGAFNSYSQYNNSKSEYNKLLNNLTSLYPELKN